MYDNQARQSFHHHRPAHSFRKENYKNNRLSGQDENHD